MRDMPPCGYVRSQQSQGIPDQGLYHSAVTRYPENRMTDRPHPWQQTPQHRMTDSPKQTPQQRMTDSSYQTPQHRMTRRGMVLDSTPRRAMVSELGDRQPERNLDKQQEPEPQRHVAETTGSGGLQQREVTGNSEPVGLPLPDQSVRHRRSREQINERNPEKRYSDPPIADPDRNMSVSRRSLSEEVINQGKGNH